MMMLGMLLVGGTVSFWWRDVVREGMLQGKHTRMVQRGLKMGFVLFLMSEVMLFFSIFWAYFHASLAPTVELGAV